MKCLMNIEFYYAVGINRSLYIVNGCNRNYPTTV